MKALREALGLSQEAFAEKAGLGYKYYQHVESGRRRDIRLSTLEKLAKACGLELWELFHPVHVAKATAADLADQKTSLLFGKDARKTRNLKPNKKAQ